MSKIEQKTYVLMIAKRFPKGHPREGEPTYFFDKIKTGIKIHTIRRNYDLWVGRIREVQAGRAVLSLRQWSGKPYRSKQIEFMRLGKDDGVGIEKINILNQWAFTVHGTDDDCGFPSKIEVADNDGLRRVDFDAWFEGAEFPMAVIHFTDFRYCK